MSKRCTGPGASQEVYTKVSCHLPGVTQHELQSELRMAATFAGFDGTQEKSSCKPVPVVFSAGPGFILQVVLGNYQNKIHICHRCRN